MSVPINDAPAFPCIYYSEPIGSIGPQLTIKGGMTLRDYFAAAALPQVDQRSHGNLGEIALECYQIADAMIRAREVKP
jgi:hypothetical protein